MRTFVAELAVLLHGDELCRGSVGVVSPRHVAVRFTAGAADERDRCRSKERVEWCDRVVHFQFSPGAGVATSLRCTKLCQMSLLAGRTMNGQASHAPHSVRM